jgi:hypothetical protein
MDVYIKKENWKAMYLTINSLMGRTSAYQVDWPNLDY